jgi:hypothetical protein
VRNFGIASRSVHSDAAERRVEVKNQDTAILTVSGVALIALAIIIYALAFGFSVEREISGFLSFLP